MNLLCHGTYGPPYMYILNVISLVMDNMWTSWLTILKQRLKKCKFQ